MKSEWLLMVFPIIHLLFLICANILKKVAPLTKLLGFLFLILEKIFVLNTEWEIQNSQLWILFDNILVIDLI